MSTLNCRRAVLGALAGSLLIALLATPLTVVAEAGPRKRKAARVKIGQAYFGDQPGNGPGNGAADGAEVLLYEDASASVVSVRVWLDATGQTGEFYGYKSSDPDGTGPLPFGVKSVSRLSGRAFEIVDADGGVVVSSQLPRIGKRTLGGEFTRGSEPFSLRIANKRGTLQHIAELKALPIQ